MGQKIEVPIFKNLSLNINDKAEYERILYVEKYCLNLLQTKQFSKESVEIIAQCMLERNEKMDQYLMKEVEDDHYHYTVYLVYQMMKTGLFNEDDYYDAAELDIDNMFEERMILKKLIKEKIDTI